MSFNRPRLLTILTFFTVLMAGILYHQYNSQVTLAREVEDIQQEFMRQRQENSTLVWVMEELRKDKSKVEGKLDSVLEELEAEKLVNDSLEKVSLKTIKKLKHEIYKMRRTGRDTVLSPLEYRYRSENPDRKN
jgi:Tfp pilus assembly protein PilO